MRKLSINPVPCTGCLNCQVVCALKWSGRQDPSASAIRVTLDLMGGKHNHTVCRQCSSPRCAEVCPNDAISKDDGTGALIINTLLCTSCGLCVEACPYGAMFRRGDELGPVKCDLCGGQPLCAEACSFGVIRYMDADDQNFNVSCMPQEEQDPRPGRGDPAEVIP